MDEKENLEQNGACPLADIDLGCLYDLSGLLNSAPAKIADGSDPISLGSSALVGYKTDNGWGVLA